MSTKHINSNVVDPLCHVRNIDGFDDVNGANGVAYNDRLPYVPIAVCGMALRAPGGIHTPEELWDLVINKGETRTLVPEDRFNVNGFYSEQQPKQGTINFQHGYFLTDESLQQFDAGFFSMSRREVERLDPQQRLLLEVVFECMESAGETKWRGKNIGCMVGTYGQDWSELALNDKLTTGLYNITGQGDFLLSNRVSFEYDLKGPSFTVKTACSSAAIALHMACEALSNRECEGVIVGGTSILTAPGAAVAMTEQGIISPEGRCKPFDAAADGYARAEALNAIYVRRLDDALRDGSAIRTIIRGTALNCDGKSASLASPSSEAHEMLIRQAYAAAGLQLNTPYVECHGTGTAVGDPLETAAIGRVFGNGGTYIGSVKANIGHSEGASSITSLIKAALALEKKIIPPNIYFKTPNPKIPFKDANLIVPMEPTQWPEGRCERVSINSFGLGGANAHVILESTSSMGLSHTQESVRQRSCELLLLSAHHSESLEKSVHNYKQYLERHQTSAYDLAYTLAMRRDHMRHRACMVVDSCGSIGEVHTSKEGASLKFSFVFTGQGAQWPQMGKSLMADFPTFAATIKAMDAALAKLVDPPSWSIAVELLAPEAKSRLDRPEFSQPLCTAIQVGMVRLWNEVGIVPDSVIGHSSGEIAAAYAAGALTLEDAAIVAYYRGQIAVSEERKGSMLAVGLGSCAVESFLVEGAIVACVNSSSSVTVSGDEEAVVQVAERVKSAHPEVLVRQLRVQQAYHSHHMKEVGGRYYKHLVSNITPSKPHIPFFSTVYGRLLDDDASLDSKYWQANLESPVLFDAGIQSLLLKMGASDRTILEVGPHSALAGPLRQIFRDTKAAPHYTSTMLRNEDSTSCFLHAVGQLWIRGVGLDISSLYPTGMILTDLPPYPWYHQENFWEENRIAKKWRFRSELPHEILGTPLLEWNDNHPTWRNILATNDVQWLRDHKIGSDVVFPAAGYIAMIGEAIRELSGEPDFTLRDVVISSALVLDSNVELNTVLQKAQLTTNQTSDWYDFTISSYTGSSWIKHCWGQALPGRSDSIREDTPISDLPSVVDSERWYSVMSKVGLNYTGAFRSMEHITADPLSNRATAVVQDKIEPMETRYHLHPSTIDSIFQLLTVASAHGQARLFNNLSVPTYIESIYINGVHKASKLQAQMSVENSVRGGIIGHGSAFSNNDLAFHLHGLKTSPLGAEDSNDLDPHAAVQQDWKPHIDYIDPTKLIHATKDYRTLIGQLEKVFYLSAIDTLDRIAGIQISEDYLVDYRDWLYDHVDKTKDKGSVLFEGASEIYHLTKEQREEAIVNLHNQLLESEMRHYAIAVERIRVSSQDIFRSAVEPLDLLMEDGNLHKIYDFLCFWNYEPFMKILGHNKPTMRVLEIGAGTGGVTGMFLNALQSDFKERLYSSYTYTDISPGFFTAARERFQSFDGIEYKVLDVSKDPAEQGFEEHSYDLIIAANVLHATPSLSETLRNVRRLLHPSGRLLLQELIPAAKCINYIFGILPGWWLGANDGRKVEPYVTPEQWNQVLRETGFSGADTVVYDNDIPYQINATILACVATNSEARQKRRIALIYAQEISQLQKQYADSLIAEGFDIQWQEMSSPLSDGQDVVSLLELEQPYLHDIDAVKFDELIKWLSSLRDRGIMWLLPSVQMGCADPRFAQMLGLARNIRSEMSIDFATLELHDPRDMRTSQVAAQLFKTFQNRIRSAAIDPDFEFSIVGDVPYIGRFHWFPVDQELLEREKSPLKSIARLEIERPGLLQSLRYVQTETMPLEPDELLIKVHATGLNFKDVLIAMGVIDTAPLGIETAGIVEAVGSQVEEFNIGDRVMGLAAHCFASHVKGKAITTVKIPDTLAFSDAATMPCVYGTVIRSLIDLGKLEMGQTVLIHSACGGVGIAAIHICQMLGAEVFATVGSQDKLQYLTETFGIPAKNIFNSRDSSFYADVMRATEGRGVDLCLNSLSGELLNYSWQCVAEFGTLLEIGKRDLVGRGKISLHPFEDNRNYIGIDLSHIWLRRPELWKKLLNDIIRLHNEGHIHPIAPIKVFGANDTVSMFRFMQKGAHIGKVVLDMAVPSAELKAVPRRQKISFRANASYLLTGGLGGLGKSTARWMVQHGVTSLILLSRRGRTSADETFCLELESAGCSVFVLAGSVDDESKLRQLLQDVKNPIAGVIHGAMVLRDHATRDMPFEKWQAVMMPRVAGTWNLHNVLKDSPLDFFVLLSSFSGIVGQWGQANYAASNTFLDAFVQFRQKLGLPASALDMGPITDVGYVAEAPEILKSLQATNAYAIGEKEYLDALQLGILRSYTGHCQVQPGLSTFTDPAVFGLGMRSTTPLDDPSNRTIWRRDIRLSVYRNLEKKEEAATNSVENEGLKQLLAAAHHDESTIDALATEIGKILFGFLMRPEEDIVINVPLGNLGVDSLVSIELRNWLRQQLSLEVSVLEVMQSNLQQLAKQAIEMIQSKRSGLVNGQAQMGTLPEEREHYRQMLQVKVP